VKYNSQLAEAGAAGHDKPLFSSAANDELLILLREIQL